MSYSTSMFSVLNSVSVGGHISGDRINGVISLVWDSKIWPLAVLARWRIEGVTLL